MFCAPVKPYFHLAWVHTKTSSSGSSIITVECIVYVLLASLCVSGVGKTMFQACLTYIDNRSETGA